MNPNIYEIRKAIGEYESGEIDRRSFLRSLTLLGVSTFVANAVVQSPLGASKAFAAIGGPEERAWALAKEAAAKATKKSLTLLIPTGSIGNMTPYVEKWKNELGITLEFIEEPDEVVHTKGMQEAVAKTGRYDVMKTGFAVQLTERLLVIDGAGGKEGKAVGVQVQRMATLASSGKRLGPGSRPERASRYFPDQGISTICWLPGA